jgi:hypothetical protein
LLPGDFADADELRALVAQPVDRIGRISKRLDDRMAEHGIVFDQ